MILIQCIENVYGETVSAESDFMEERLLFKVDHFYIADQDEDGHLITQDEEGEPHIVADNHQFLSSDSWFSLHFKLA
ncbi:hypothetical protein [Sporolactobacillus spathodeae]|uniref:Uncharacterized protein n=1 Tax=Sporolactobacillus spathodeae TaxID=1465502 RepID=A0ABS2QBD1_9BACL|nr:hypothetical protein [Sporolactobacillus spathodeae]MBM7659038.1 hypothetical protein [Sporolactobacillus spathodeae]